MIQTYYNSFIYHAHNFFAAALWVLIRGKNIWYWGRAHSTEVAFALPTQRPLVRFSAQEFFKKEISDPAELIDRALLRVIVDSTKA